MLSIKNFLKRIFEIRKNQTKNLLSQIAKESGGITLLDIGAAGDIQPRWLMIAKELNYIAFEPDKRSYEKLLNTHNCRKYNVIKEVVWSSKEKISFNLCEDPQVSSIFEPNKEFLNKYPNSKRFDIKEKKYFTTSTLDIELFDNIVDFVKLDIQGAEYFALKGMKNKLKDCIGLEIEIEFSPMYINQPLFGQVNDFLRKQGFEFIDFTNICRWERKIYNSYGQIIFGDGLWLRSPEYILKNQADKIIKYITICSLYGRYDLVNEVINFKSLTFTKQFKKALNKLIKRQKRTRTLNYLFNLISRFSDGQENTRSHLIY